jgi:hypothetical protein
MFCRRKIVTQPMNRTAWMWTRTGEAKVERPIASWKEKPATITRVMTIALLRKKRSSPTEGTSGAWARVAIPTAPAVRGDSSAVQRVAELPARWSIGGWRLWMCW